MLVYHPAFDFHHTVFRILLILETLPQSAYEVDRIRILDFYFLFPAELADIRYPRGVRVQRRLIEEKHNKYEQLLDRYQLLMRMEPYQMEALRCLASHDLISVEDLKSSLVTRTERAAPQRLEEAFRVAEDGRPIALSLLTGPLKDLRLHGKDGLRGRTELIGYRYDAS